MKQVVNEWDKQLTWGWLAEHSQWVLNMSIAIQQIPAPTFAEKERAEYVLSQFRALYLDDAFMDEGFNVYGLIRGKEPHRPAVMISAHTDTVFAPDTHLQIKRDGDWVYGPGLGDNSIGVAGLLGLIAGLRHLNIQPRCDIWLVADTREEGLGDLGGMKMAFNRLRDRIGMVINLEGMAFGHVYHSGIAVRRLHITAQAEGGHSWLNFGRSSAIHGIVELGHAILQLTLPDSPRTTYNIGMIEGGQSINTIATEAGLWLDMRSENSPSLALIENDVQQIISQLQRPNLSYTAEVVGDRPAGSIAPDHPLVQMALAALEQVGVRGTLETGSTDANVPLSLGYPAITVGITRGGNAHRLDEYIETKPIANGMRQLILLTIIATES